MNTQRFFSFVALLVLIAHGAQGAAASVKCQDQQKAAAAKEIAAANVVEGDIFLAGHGWVGQVGNHAKRLSKHLGRAVDRHEYMVAVWFTSRDNDDEMPNRGSEMTATQGVERAVQLDDEENKIRENAYWRKRPWVSKQDSRSDNWHAHEHPTLGRVPEFLPLTSLKGLVEEGSVAQLSLNGFPVVLRACQLQYRSQHLGPFQQALYTRLYGQQPSRMPVRADGIEGTTAKKGVKQSKQGQ